jgi:DNA-binding MarR family transcriptional regulator
MSGQVLIDQSRAVGAWARMLRGHAAMRRSLAARLQRDHGLTINEYEALKLLSRAKGKSMRRVDLAERLQLTASGVTRLLDGLERHGLVTKATCATDARVTYAVVTKSGRRKLEEASRSHVVAISGVFEHCYTRQELATLADLLAKLPGAADEEVGAAR